MNKKLLFLQSCVRRDISTDDLGYLTKWLFVDFDNITDEQYFNKVQSMIEINFFNQTRSIKEILEFYNGKLNN